MILQINCDGGSRGNPGPAACAFVAKDDAGVLLEKRGKYLGKATNNEAEYQAVIEAWKYIQWLGEREKVVEVHFLLDSNLVVNQINGKFRVKEPRMGELLKHVKELQRGSRVVSYDYVPREQNSEADLLVNQTLDENL